MWFTQTLIIFTGVSDTKKFIHLTLPLAVLAIFSILFATVVAMSRYSQTGGYVMIILCLLASVVYYWLMRTELSLSIVVVASISAYQYFYSVKHVTLVWWTEIFVVLLVGVQYLLETGFSAVVLRSEGTSCCSGAFAQLMSDTLVLRNYNLAGSFNLVVYALVPFPDAGIYSMNAGWKIALFAATWYFLLLSEDCKQALCKGYIYPRASFKCAPLLYMPPYFWAIPLLVAVCNAVMVVKYKKNKDSQDNEENV